MSKDAKDVKQAPAPQAQAPKVVAGTDKCKSDDCKKKQEKFGFCMEHYEWYMDGLIRGDGRKPSDFAEKFSVWQQRKQKKVA